MKKMYKVEIGGTLRRIIQIFYVFRIWRNENESEFRKSCRRLLFLVYQISFIVFMLTIALLSDDKNQLIFSVEVGIIAAVLIIKLWYLLYRKDDIYKFLYDPTVTHCIRDRDDWMQVNKKTETVIKFIQVYVAIVTLSGLVSIIVPLSIFTKEKTSNILPWFIHFDVESDCETIFYWMAFVYTSTCGIVSVVSSYAMVFIWYIMLHYSIEYKLLGNEFRKLGHSGTTKAARSSFQRDLIDLICAHSKLFDTIERFRSCFSTIFFTQIFTGAISICGTTYNLAYNVQQNLFQIAYFVVLLLYAFLEIFLIMYLANEVTIESDRLCYSLFESNWTKQPEATKACIIILCEAVKRPHQLVIFVYPMNLESFTSIVNGAYRMFNILQSLK